MMGYQEPPQSKLFYTGLNIDQKVRKNHPLRNIHKVVDFEFIYKEVADTYGGNGNVSTPPPVILKLMLLLVLYNVRSERELMETVPEGLDWLWFLGYDLDTKIPDHSVLSKARKRWGVETFKAFFERIVWQCVESGLVDGSKIFVDSSLIEANASNNSAVDTHSLKRHLDKSYIELEKRLEEQDECLEEVSGGKGEVNKRYISTTDPEAAITRQGVGKAKLSYKTHRAVDYGAPKKECSKCILRPQCTSNKSGRTIKRHLRQDELDYMRANTRTDAAKRDIRMRQHLMERSFARGKRYGYDRSRWRGLWRVQVQEYMTAAIQNIEVLIRHAKGPVRVAMAGTVMDTIKTGVYSIKYFFTRVKSGLFFIKDMQQNRATVTVLVYV